MDSIMIDNHEVRSTECLKLLGVCIDNNLRFDEHISSISKKSAQRVGVLMRLRNLIPTQTKLQLYKAAVLPYLTYLLLRVLALTVPIFEELIHLGVPYTKEEYYQEAGRDISYNCYDISKAKCDTIIKFIKSTTECKHEIILHRFGHSASKRRDGGHNCCDHHRSICICEHCKTEKE